MKFKLSMFNVSVQMKKILDPFAFGKILSDRKTVQFKIIICDCFIMLLCIIPGLPTHLLQELNVVTLEVVVRIYGTFDNNLII